MRLQQVIDTLGIEPTDSWEDILPKYRNLAKRYHPDLVGDASSEMMKLINEAHETARNKWADIMSYLNTGNGTSGNEFLGDKILRVYQSLKSLSGINIELIGSWLWITGDTKPVKDYIKEIGQYHECGVGFSKSKLAWYIKPDKRHRKGKNMDWKSMKQMWGHQDLTTEDDEEKAGAIS